LSDNQIRVRFGSKDGLTIFRLDPLTHSISLSHFACPVEEYNDWLFQDAFRSQHDHIARTWLLRERATGSVAAYMSLVMDAIKLSFTERELHNLNYPFKTIPAMKIAKLAECPCGGRKPVGFSSLNPILAENQRWADRAPPYGGCASPSGAQCRHKGVLCPPRTMPDTDNNR
jgi:hypothetical protein